MQPRDQHVFDEVIRLTKQGVSASTLSERFDVSIRTINRWRVSAGVAKPAPIHRAPEVWAEAKRLIAEGMNLHQVASAIGVAHPVVYRKFPDAPRLTPTEVGQMAMAHRRAGM